MFCLVLKKENKNSSSNKIQQSLEENTNKGDMLPIIITSNTHIQSFVKGYYVYKHWWTRVIEKYLITKMEPSSARKYAVSVNKDDLIVEHLPFAKNEEFSKKILYLLWADRYAKLLLLGKQWILVMEMMMVCKFPVH